MRTSYFKILAIFCLYSGCSESSDLIEGIDFPESENIEGEKVLIDELSWQVEVAGDYIFCELESSKTELYNVYQAGDLSFVGTVGNRGQGPDEFIGAQYSGQYFYDSLGNTNIWVNDAPKFRISALNLNSSLKTNKTIVSNRLRHHPKYNFQNALFVLGESDLAGFQPGFIEGTNLKPLNFLTNGVLSSVGSYPRVKNSNDIPGANSLFKNLDYVHLGMKPDQEKFAVALSHYDRVDIYNRDGSLVKSIGHSENYRQYEAHEIFSETKGLVGIKNYYMTVRTTDKYIYAVSHGRDRKADVEGITYSSEIRVFAWDGSIIRVLKCPNDLISLAIDEKRGFLYGHDMSIEGMVRFDITELIESYEKP